MKRKKPANPFDCSDVKWEFPKAKNRRQVILSASSETDFNLMKLYLSLIALTEKIEQEMGVLEEMGEH